MSPRLGQTRPGQPVNAVRLLSFSLGACCAAIGRVTPLGGTVGRRLLLYRSIDLASHGLQGSKMGVSELANCHRKREPLCGNFRNGLPQCSRRMFSVQFPVCHVHHHLVHFNGPCGSQALWALARAGLIADPPDAKKQSQYAMVLTPSGTLALSTFAPKNTIALQRGRFCDEPPPPIDWPP